MHAKWGTPKGMVWDGVASKHTYCEAFLFGEWRRVDSVSWNVSDGIFCVRDESGLYYDVKPELFRYRGLLFVDREAK